MKGGVSDHAVSRLKHQYNFEGDKKTARRFLRRIVRESKSSEHFVPIPPTEAQELGIEIPVFIVLNEKGKILTIMQETEF